MWIVSVQVNIVMQILFIQQYISSSLVNLVETADTIAALQLAKANDVATLAIVNVIGSTIARDADHVIYTKAGPEICVATTKAYCTQVAVLSLLACYLSYVHGHMQDDEVMQLSKEIKTLPKLMQQLIEKDYSCICKENISA
mgnify:CR=1 FL=1